MTPIVTHLSSSEPGTPTSTNAAIIAGSTVGAVAFLSLALALVLFYRRHNNKKLNFFRRSEPRPRSMLFAGEDLDDDYDLSPPMYGYKDYPGSLVSAASSHASSNQVTLAPGPEPRKSPARNETPPPDRLRRGCPLGNGQA